MEIRLLAELLMVVAAIAALTAVSNDNDDDFGGSNIATRIIFIAVVAYIVAIIFLR